MFPLLIFKYTIYHLCDTIQDIYCQNQFTSNMILKTDVSPFDIQVHHILAKLIAIVFVWGSEMEFYVEKYNYFPYSF